MIKRGFFVSLSRGCDVGAEVGNADEVTGARFVPRSTFDRDTKFARQRMSSTEFPSNRKSETLYQTLRPRNAQFDGEVDLLRRKTRHLFATRTMPKWVSQFREN